jgi:SAM-dependent methyltransferase
VLDIGCGPGRHVAELAGRACSVLGIDITEVALGIARRRGAVVMQRSVFDRVPGTGRWRTVLLLDGNIGIGGDPEKLLRRVRAILAEDGIALVELAPPGSPRSVRRVRLEIDGAAGPVFRWSQLPVEDLDGVADAAGFVVARLWCSDSRWFARLDRTHVP